MIIRVPLDVPCYVFQYLTIEYGSGPYDLSDTRLKEIKDAFLYGEFRAAAIPPALDAPSATYLIYLEIRNGSKIAKALRDRGGMRKETFFLHEFWSSCIQYTNGIMDATGAARMVALEKFMEKYNIDEEMYPLDTAYRILQRWMKKRRDCQDPEINLAIRHAIAQKRMQKQKKNQISSSGNQLSLWKKELTPVSA